MLFGAVAGLCDLPAMAAPAAIVAYVPPLEFTSITATVLLDGSASTSGIANPALTYLWELKTKPTGSAATLSATNTATVNLLNVDMSGTFIAWLRVMNADGVWSEQVFEVTPNTEPASRVYVNVKTQNLGLIPTGLWGRTMQDLSAGDPGYNDEQQKTYDLFAAVDAIGGTVPAGGLINTFYATPESGSATATGTASDPFNTTSAAANGYAGPIAQIVAAVTAARIALNPEQGATAYLYGGTYSEDVSITASLWPWTIIPLGQVALGAHTFTYTTGAFASWLAQPNLIIAGGSEGQILTATSSLRLGNVDAHVWTAYLRGVAFNGAIVSGALTAGPTMVAWDSNFTAAFNIPNLAIPQMTMVVFGDDVTAKSMGIMERCKFGDDITVSSAPPSDSRNGFYDCGWPGTPLFTGPASTALFDPITAARFIAASGTFAGGAGKADFLPITTSAITIDNGAGTGALTTRAITTPVSTSLTVSAGSTMSVSATTTLDLGAGGAATLTAGAGADVTVTGGSNHGVVLAGGAGSTYDAKFNTLAARSGSTIKSATEVFSPNVRTAVLPLAVSPNGSFSTLSYEGGYDGTTTGDCDFVCAVAATSVVGDITVAVRQGDGTVIAAATTIDGLTEQSIGFSPAAFVNGFYVEVVSDNVDAIQGAGLQCRVRYTISGPT